GMSAASVRRSTRAGRFTTISASAGQKRVRGAFDSGSAMWTAVPPVPPPAVFGLTIPVLGIALPPVEAPAALFSETFSGSPWIPPRAALEVPGADPTALDAVGVWGTGSGSLSPVLGGEGWGEGPSGE